MEDFSIHDYIAVLKRRRLAFFLTFAIFVGLSVAVTFLWNHYRAEAIIQVQAPDIPEGMTTPMGMTASAMIQALATKRIEQIEEKVTSTASLIEIITKFNLYSKQRQIEPITEIVSRMRKRIKLELLQDQLTNPSGLPQTSMTPDQMGAIAVTLRFTDNDPSVAQHVANELVSRILDEDLKQRRTESKETAEFLGAQVESLEKTMAEQEKKIAEYKHEHPNTRPENLQLNQQELAMIQINIQQLDSQMAALERSRGDLRAQLAGVDPYSRVLADGQALTTPSVQLKALQAKYSIESMQYGADHPDVIKLRHQLEALQAELGETPDTAILESQIRDVRTNLAAAEKTDGPDHPDVLALKRQLTGLEDRLAMAAHDPTRHDEMKKDADNPAYLMLMAQLQASDEQAKSLALQKEGMERQREKYQLDVMQTPEVEQGLAALSRDYDNAQLRYRELKEKKLAADMGEQMQQGRIAQRLVVIDPPQLPTDTYPKRIYILAGTLFLSIFCGIGGVVLAETMSRSVHGPRHLAALTGAMPMVVIPHIFTAEERRKIRRTRIRTAVATVSVFVIGGYVFNSAVMPLDVFVSIVANRLGIS